MPHDVFISHSKTDKTVADAVCAKLEAENIRCWIAPRDIFPGADWAGAIVGALESCRVMILIFSSSSNTSPQVKREVEQAFNNGLIVVPFRIEDVQPNQSLKYYIGSVHWLDALTTPLEQHIARLVPCVKAIMEVNISCPLTPAINEPTKTNEVLPAREDPRPSVIASETYSASMPYAKKTNSGKQPAKNFQNLDKSDEYDSLAGRQARFESAMAAGARGLASGNWIAAEAAYRRAMAVPGFDKAGIALDGIKSAQAGFDETYGLAEQQRIEKDKETEKRRSEEHRLAEEKRIAERDSEMDELCDFIRNISVPELHVLVKKLEDKLGVSSGFEFSQEDLSMPSHMCEKMDYFCEKIDRFGVLQLSILVKKLETRLGVSAAAPQLTNPKP